MISNDPKFNLGQLNAYKLMFAIKLLMEKPIKNFWSAGFSDLPAINATVFNCNYEGCTIFIRLLICSLIGCGLVQAHYSFKNIDRKSITTVNQFIKMASAASDIM